MNKKNYKKICDYCRRKGYLDDIYIIDDIEKIEFVINKEMSLDFKLLKMIVSLKDEFNVKIASLDFNTWESILYTKDEVYVLLKNAEQLKKLYNFDLTFEGEFTVEQAVFASLQIDKWANEINNAKVNGYPLSPFEKFLYAYSICTQFKYNPSENGLQSRSLIGVINSNYIVCVGYANLLKELCERIRIKCLNQRIKINGENEVSHLNCCVLLEDEKYNIKGVYYSDPCWDNSHFGKYANTINYSLITYSNFDLVYSQQLSYQNNRFCMLKVRYDEIKTEIFDLKKNIEKKEKQLDLTKKFLKKNLFNLHLEEIVDNFKEKINRYLINNLDENLDNYNINKDYNLNFVIYNEIRNKIYEYLKNHTKDEKLKTLKINNYEHNYEYCFKKFLAQYNNPQKAFEKFKQYFYEVKDRLSDKIINEIDSLFVELNEMKNKKKLLEFDGKIKFSDMAKYVKDAKAIDGSDFLKAYTRVLMSQNFTLEEANKLAKMVLKRSIEFSESIISNYNVKYKDENIKNQIDDFFLKKGIEKISKSHKEENDKGMNY